MNKFKLNLWINNQRKKTSMKIQRVNLKDINNWVFNVSSIFHKKGKFFSILPYKFKTNFGKKKSWDQPLILQDEIGILGIIKKKLISGDQYLLQAKIEPGNINNIQLAPTVQATKSNYLRAHGGKKTKFLNFFRKENKNCKIISKVRLSEQGTRYFEKLNNNILIEIKNVKLKLHSNFIWVTKENLDYLIKRKNLLNMDTISVFSCSISKNLIDFPKNNFSKINNTIGSFKKKYYLKKKQSSFKDLNLWKVDDKKIFDIKKNFFSVIGIDVETNSREIQKWGQPIISDHSLSFNGFLLKRFNRTNHYLLQLVLEPGFKNPKYTSTVSIKNFSKKNSIISSIEYFKFFLKKKNIILDIVNSDEGGRFYKNETRNIVAFLDKKEILRPFKNYIWASHNQVVEMINKNLLAIEARNLFACFNIDKIK